ncbi:MAG: ferrochelatase [Polyangiaceae bacterium]
MNSLLEHLERLDADLDSRGVKRLSLDPDRDRASRLHELGAALLERPPTLDAPALDALASGLTEVVEAIADNFPENVFWDLDYLVAALAKDAAAQADSARYLQRQLEIAADLHRMFGRHSPIRFRYIHDFVYGYDWAKWVRRDPEPRAEHGPFSSTFLSYTKQRGEELVELIARNDAKYHRLADDAVARNPFGFSREPEAEVALHRDLARRDLIPVRAWRWDAEPRFDEDFADRRKQRAVAMGYGL